MLDSILLALCLALVPVPASAYVDPGAGSYMVQMAVAGALGALYLLKVFWRRIVGFFAGKKNDEGQGDGPAKGGDA